MPKQKKRFGGTAKGRNKTFSPLHNNNNAHDVALSNRSENHAPHAVAAASDVPSVSSTQSGAHTQYQYNNQLIFVDIVWRWMVGWNNNTNLEALISLVGKYNWRVEYESDTV